LINNANISVCYVQISLVTEDTWGEDWLGNTEVISVNGTRVFDVPAGAYDMRALDCDQEELDVRWAVRLDRPYTWTVGDGTGGGELDYTLEPDEGSIELAAGFDPQPHRVDFIAGGPVDVGALGLGDNCYGFAGSNPDFRLHWTGPSSRLRVFFISDGGADTALVVNDPTANWRCADDSPGSPHPLLEINDPESGQYDIWVTTLEEGAILSGTLYITNEDWGPDNLP
jgi:hypothetical protein